MAVVLERKPQNFIPDEEEVPREEIEEIKEIKVRMHLLNLVPWSIFRSNRKSTEWAKEANYNDGVEWMALQLDGLPFGPTHEVQVNSVTALSEVVMDIKSAHVVFNPFATIWGILTRRPDRIAPGQRLPFFLLSLASQPVSYEAIKKLERVKGNLPVVTFPSRQGENIFGEYQGPLVQTQALYFDKMTPEQMIAAVEEGHYAGVCIDLLHMREAARDGSYPFLPGKEGGKTDAWKYTLEKFWRAGVLKEVHVQPGGGGQLEHGISEESRRELGALIGGVGEYSTELDQMVRFLKYELRFPGPYVTEINPLALIPLKGVKVLRPRNLIEIHREIVDHIKRT